MATAHTLPATKRPQRIKQWGWTFCSYGIGAGCLYWVFHDIPVHQAMRSIARMDWWGLPLIVSLDLVVYVCAAWEWQILLRPIGQLSLGRALQALFAGRFANDVLPMHVGYLLRLYLAARWTRATLTSAVPSLLVERFFDSLWLALSIGANLLFYPLPAQLVHTGEALGGLILLGSIALIWIAARGRKDNGAQSHHGLFRWKTARRVREFFYHVADGVRGIARSYLLALALGLSVLKLALQGAAFFLLLKSFGFDFSFWICAAIFLVAYVGMSLPSTPASVGVFQVFCIAGLRFFGISKAVASGFSLVAFTILTVPLSVGGALAFARTGLGWRQLRNQIGEWKNAGKNTKEVAKPQ